MVDKIQTNSRRACCTLGVHRKSSVSLVVLLFVFQHKTSLCDLFCYFWIATQKYIKASIRHLVHQYNIKKIVGNRVICIFGLKWAYFEVCVAKKSYFATNTKIFTKISMHILKEIVLCLVWYIKCLKEAFVHIWEAIQRVAKGCFTNQLRAKG